MDENFRETDFVEISGRLLSLLELFNLDHGDLDDFEIPIYGIFEMMVWGYETGRVLCNRSLIR